MSAEMDSIKNYPDISFIDNLTLEGLQKQMISDVEAKYKALTGEEMAESDPIRMFLYAVSLQIYQAFQYIDHAGKQSFLKYATGEYLDNLGALKGVARSKGTQARAEMRFVLSGEQRSAVTIPAGIRVTTDAGDGIYFYTADVAEIPAGGMAADVAAYCTETGAGANGLEPGELCVLVDPIPYIQSVANTETTGGGAGEETDENLAERILLAPSGYSAAGSAAAYKYHIRKHNTRVDDVLVSSPTEGRVDIRFLLQGGEIPDGAAVADMQEYLGGDEFRPLTDFVTVGIPDQVEYGIALAYWIGASDRARAGAIQDAVAAAVEEYKAWQRGKIGRDINPSRLVYLVVRAGAKRAEVTSPAFREIPDTSIAIPGSLSLVYGGVEDD